MHKNIVYEIKLEQGREKSPLFDDYRKIFFIYKWYRHLVILMIR